MTTTETIGQRIARFQRRAGLKGYQLAALAHIHPSTLSQIVNGKRTPERESIAGLARALGVRRDEIDPEDFVTTRVPAPPAERQPPKPAARSHRPRPEAPQPTAADGAAETDQSAFISAAVHKAITAALADFIAAIIAALRNWTEEHGHREAGSGATATAVRRPPRRNRQ